MSDTSHGAPDSPETGDVDTESLYGAEPGSESDESSEEDVPELGAEKDLHSGSTGPLPEG